MKDKSALQTLVQSTLEQAMQRGATAAEASVQVSEGLAVTVRLGEVDTVEHHRDRDFVLTVYFGNRSGTASTADLSTMALSETLAKACNIAQFTQEDPCSGLADKDLLATEYPALDLYHPWNMTEQQAMELAKTCEQETFSHSKKITNSEGATVSTHDDLLVYGNTQGFLGDYAFSGHTLNCSVIAYDGHEMQREYDYTTARNPQDLEDASVLAKRLAERVVRRLGARKISTRHCPVIFSNEVARGLFGHLMSAISGGAIYRKTSLLVDHLNKKIFPQFMQIEERPHLLQAMGSAPFDAEGVRTFQKDLIREGVLCTYLLGSYSARKLGLRSTGNAGGAHNVVVHHTGETFQELLKKMDTGLLVTELIGQGVNLVTGDYSRGAFGFWVEKGVIQYPVQEITVAGNLKDIWANIVAISNDIDLRGNVRTGSVLVSDMTIAGE